MNTSSPQFLLNLSVSVSARSDPGFEARQGEGKGKGEALYDTRSHPMTGTELEATRADIRIHILISHSHRKVKSSLSVRLPSMPCIQRVTEILSLIHI